ncbi:MAG TPA: ATP-binding protein [Gemmatimonadaceae bacterium]
MLDAIDTAPGADEDELRSCVRDLVALSAMPAWWIGRAPTVIAQSLRDVLLGMLHVDSVSVQLDDAFAGSATFESIPQPRMTNPRAPTLGQPSSAVRSPAAETRLTSHATTIPVGLGGEMGVVEVCAARAFPDKLETLIMQVAVNQFAVALRYAELLGRHERAEQLLHDRAAQQSTMAQLGLRALKEPTLEGTVADVVGTARETLALDHVELLEITADDRALRLRAADGWLTAGIGEQRPLAWESVAGRALLTGVPVVVRDLRNDRRFDAPSYLRDVGVASGAAVLVPCHFGLFGVLGAYCNAPRDFTDNDLHFLQSVANVLGAAIERHRTEGERERLLAEMATARGEAEEASRAKSEFLGMMSHELRTPLNAIGGYVQLIEEGIRGPVTEAQRDDLGRIRRSQRHLLNVIENVLGFLKAGSGRVRYDLRAIPVTEIVDAAEELIRPLMAEKHLRYCHLGVGDGLRALADREKLEQIVLNLLSNATKFTDDGGRIEVRCSGDASFVRVRVTDSGVGIPADKLAMIFEPFEQVQSARRQGEGGGTGLGLAISRSFARGMGGDLLVESEIDRGSAFTVVVPRAV